MKKFTFLILTAMIFSCNNSINKKNSESEVDLEKKFAKKDEEVAEEKTVNKQPPANLPFG